MSSWRLSALPAAGRANQKLRAALLPVPSGWAQGFQSRGPVTGWPGTVRITAPAPMPGTDSSLAAQALAGNIGEPSSKFSWWTPSVYYTRLEQPYLNGSVAPVSVLSDNQMPVPSVDPRGMPGVVMPGPVMLGQTQVGNPRVAPKFMNRRATRG